MKIFDVYKHVTQGYRAVKQGFAWPAFFFTFIWAFVNKMWGDGFALLLVIITLNLVQTIFVSLSVTLVMLLAQLAFCIVVGVKGNSWRRGNLVHRGFEKMNTIEAETPDAAIATVAKSGNVQLVGPA